MLIKYSAQFLVLFISITSFGQIDPNYQIDEGHVENNTYTSEEIGWTITIPDNWQIITREQNEAFQKKGLEAIEDLVEEEIDLSAFKNLIGFQKNPFNAFQSNSEPFKIEYEGEWEENNALIKELIYNTYVQQGIKVDSTDMTILKIDGLDFHTFTFTISDPKGKVIMHQTMHSSLINGIAFGVNINYNNEADKKEMETALLNSKFRK